MTTKALTRSNDYFPVMFDDYLKPWTEWFTPSEVFSRSHTMPPANVTETKDEYVVSVAAPGLKKDDFKVDLDGNILTISSEKEEKKEEKEQKFTRKEYNYSAFSRSFTLPELVNKEKIAAKYSLGQK